MEHVFKAYRARGETPPYGFLENSKLPQPSYPETPEAIVGFGKLKMPFSGNYIVKLGQAQHIEKLFREGKLRINPASTYNDPSLNSAIRDDELSLHAFGVKAEVKMTAYDGKTGAKKGDVTPAGNLLYRTELQFDYYVFCYSRSFEPRLFADFGYDACVIIECPKTFERRVRRAVSKTLSEWDFFTSEVKYLNPFHSRRDQMHIPISKHFKYWYQKEGRFVWLPPPPNFKKLEPLDIEIGPIDDIAKLMVL